MSEFRKNSLFSFSTIQERTLRNKITIILFVCSIMVIYIHAYNLEVYGINELSVGFSKFVYLLERYFRCLNDIAVPTFFLISGVLFFRSFNINKIFQKLKSRVFSILIPYIIWCTIYYIYYVVCTNVPFIKSLMSETMYVPLSIGEYCSWLYNDVYFTLWFLRNLIVFIALTPVIWLLLNNHIKKIPTGLIALIAIVILLNANLDFLQNIKASSGLSFYLIGCYIGLNCRDKLFYSSKILSYISLLFIVFVLVTSFSYWNTVIQVLTIFSMWFALDLLNFKIDNSIFPWWMSITFFTYVMHSLILEIFEKIFLKVFGTQAIFALCDYIFMPLFTELVLILIAYVLIKYVPVIWKFLAGFRVPNISKTHCRE